MSSDQPTSGWAYLMAYERPLYDSLSTDQRLAVIDYDYRTPEGRTAALDAASEMLAQARTLTARGDAIMQVAIRATERTLKASPGYSEAVAEARRASQPKVSRRCAGSAPDNQRCWHARDHRGPCASS